MITTIAPSNITVGAPTDAHADPDVFIVRMSFCVPASLPDMDFVFELVLIDFLPSICVSSQPGSSFPVVPMIGYGIGRGLGAHGVMHMFGAIGVT